MSAALRVCSNHPCRHGTPRNHTRTHTHTHCQAQRGPSNAILHKTSALRRTHLRSIRYAADPPVASTPARKASASVWPQRQRGRHPHLCGLNASEEGIRICVASTPDASDIPAKRLGYPTAASDIPATIKADRRHKLRDTKHWRAHLAMHVERRECGLTPAERASASCAGYAECR
jgi:hypothetical protein